VIYLDANVIIRSVEGATPVRQAIEARLRAAAAAATVPSGQRYLMTSRLSLLECRCRPIRDADAALVALYDTFFAAAELRVHEIDASVIEAATRLRANYRFKSPDAIHLATAITGGASEFLTGDQQLKQCREVQVEII
jgi:predicted nucleic acid-binding protein